LRVLTEHDGYPVLAITTSAWDRAAPDALYLSAGIHGDEPAGTEALLEWAEAEGRALRHLPLLVLPCLNPWGLQENSRRDRSGRDLNREWKTSTHPLVGAVKSLLIGRRIGLALTLHEDYDGQGFYLYEPTRFRPPHVWGERIVEQVGPILPPDRRRLIDGRTQTAPGIIRRYLLSPERMAPEPEALFLHYHVADRTFTFETPSEFAIELRVAAQVAAISAAVQASRYSLQRRPNIPASY
jgi:murein peptide amidase A